MPIVFLVTAATGQSAVIDDSVLIEAAFERLRWPGQLELQLDPSAHSDCQGSLHCIASEVRAAQQERWKSHDAGRYLVIATRRAETGSPDLLSLTLIDTQAASDARTEVEAINRAIVASMAPELIPDRASMVAYLNRGYLAINQALEKAGHHRVFGRIKLEAPRAASELRLALDGSALGRLPKSEATVTGVRPGERKLTIRTAREVRFQTPIKVEAGGMTTVRVTLSEPPIRYRTIRAALMWSGFASLAAGAGLAGYGAHVRLSREGKTVISPADVSSTVDLELGQETSRSVQLPVGLALAGVGLGLGLGLWLFGDDDQAPWFQMVASAVLGGGLFAAGWAAR